MKKLTFLSTTLNTFVFIPWFKAARPDHVRVQGSSCCRPRKLVSFVRPREFYSFDARHVIRSCLIENCISDYNNVDLLI